MTAQPSTQTPAPPPAPPPPSYHRLRRFLRFLVFTLLVLYLLGAAFLYFAQSVLIFPGSLRQGHANTQVHPGPGQELVSLQTPSGHITALFSTATLRSGLPAPDDPDRRTLLYFYGNGEDLRSCLADIEVFRRHNLNVLCPEYVGYGMSSGRPSVPATYQAADAAFDYLVNVRHIPPDHIVLLGHSLGGAPAIYLASRHDVSALVTVSAFRSLCEIAQRVCPLYPVRLLIPDMPSLSYMPNVHCPTLLIHSRADELIPFSSATSVSHATPAQTTILPLDGLSHNDTMLSPHLLPTIADFAEHPSR